MVKRKAVRQTDSPSYQAWRSMINRCTRSDLPAWKHYGGRGITVCDRWMTFSNFQEDMGDRPLGLTLERKDNEKGYFPENCKWATRKEQNGNTRKTAYIEVDGARLKAREVCDRYGVSFRSVSSKASVEGISYTQAFLLLRDGLRGSRAGTAASNASMKAETAARIALIAEDWHRPEVPTKELLERAGRVPKGRRDKIPMAPRTASAYLGRRSTPRQMREAKLKREAENV